MVIARHRESEQGSHVARQFQIGVAVIHPGVNASRGAVREWDVSVNDDAVVVDDRGDGDGFGLWLGRGFFLRAAKTGEQEQRDNCATHSHGQIVTRIWREPFRAEGEKPSTTEAPPRGTQSQNPVLYNHEFDS